MRLLFGAPPYYRMAAKSIMEYATSCWQLIKNGASPFKTETSGSTPSGTPGGDAPFILNLLRKLCDVKQNMPAESLSANRLFRTGRLRLLKLQTVSAVAYMRHESFYVLLHISLPIFATFRTPPRLCLPILYNQLYHPDGSVSPRLFLSAQLLLLCQKILPLCKTVPFFSVFHRGSIQNGCAALPAAFYSNGANRRRTAMWKRCG